jgi:flagellar hook-associated protein 2
VRSQLRNMLGTTSGASSVFARLSDVGFDVQTDGTIKLKASQLDNALANVPELKKLFTNTDLAVPANNGVMAQLRTLTDSFLNSEGALTTRTEGLQRRVALNKDQQARLEDRVSAYETRVRAQYTALDQKMGQLTGLSTYVTQQMSLLNRNLG